MVQVRKNWLCRVKVKYVRVIFCRKTFFQFHQKTHYMNTFTAIFMLSIYKEQLLSILMCEKMTIMNCAEEFAR